MIILSAPRLYQCRTCSFTLWYDPSDMRRIISHRLSHLLDAVKES